MASTDDISTSEVAQVFVPECGNCDSHDGIEYQCMDCQVDLCINCKKYHEISKLTKFHTIVPHDKSTFSLSFNGYSNKPKLFISQACRSHVGKEAELYCNTCNVPVCTLCILSYHKSHELSSIDEVKNSSIRKIQRKSENLEVIIAQKRYELAAIKEWEIRLTESASSARKICQESIKKFIVKIYQYEKEINAHIDKLESAEKERLVFARTSVEKDIERAISLKSDSKLHIETKPNTAIDFCKGLTSSISMLSVTFDFSNFNTIHFEGSDASYWKPKKLVGTVYFKANKNRDQDAPVKMIETILTFPTKHASKIRAICPMIDGTAILIHYDSNDLTVIDRKGTEIKTLTVRTFVPYDVACYDNFLHITSGDGPLVLKMHLSNGRLELFHQFEKFNACGIAISDDNYVFICLKAILRYKKFGKIVKMTPDAVVVQEFSNNQEGFPLFTKPRRITCLGDGCFAVIDVNSAESKVLVIDSAGTLLGTWNGKDVNGKPEINGKLDLCGVAIFKERQVMLVTDWKTNHIYCLEIDPKRKHIASKFTFKIQRPYSVAVNTTGNVFVGCGDGFVHNLMIS